MNRIIRAALALGLPATKTVRGTIAKIAVVALSVIQLVVPLSEAQAATLSSAKVALSDPRPSQTAVNYTVTVSGVSATALRCIKATYVTSPGGSTAISAPFSTSSATVNAGSTLLSGSSGTWNISNTANSIQYTNTSNSTAPSTTTGATFIMQNINNGSTADTSYWLQFATFSDSGCSSPIDNVTMGFIYTNGSTLSLTVDQTLTFTVNAVGSTTSCAGSTTTAASTATTIPFGTVSPASNGLVCQDLTASTNATNGYTIYARYTAAPTNGIGQTIADWTGTNGAPTSFPAAGATEAYGYTTNDQTLSVTGNGANRFYNGSAYSWSGMTTTNSEVAYEAAGVNSTTYRIGHQVDVTTLTKPGTYTTTVIYTCTPVY